jgi:hypothetical protein
MTYLWLAKKAFGLWKRMGDGLASIAGWAARNPIPAALLIVTGIAAFEWHEIDVRGRTIARLTGEAAQFRQAQAAATQIAQQALHHQEAVYKAKATEADSAYQAQVADAQSAADRYIAAHRVRSAVIAGGAIAPIATATGVSPNVSSILPADAVVVSQSDLQACTDVTSYAVSAHNWAVSLDQ